MAIPEGWTLATLGDVARLQRGFDLPATVRTDGEVPVIASNGVVGSHSEARVRGPGVVTGRSGTIGKVFFIAQDFWPLNTTLYVEDFHGNEPQFIAFFLRHIELGRFVAATGVPSLNRNFVHPLEVILPPLPEQKKIAAILSSVDEVIAKTEAVIAQLQIVKKAMMEQLLTKGMPDRHTRFKQTEIGEIPEEWEVVCLDSVVQEKGQYGANAAKQQFDPALPRFVRITDIDASGRLRKEDPVSIDWDTAQGYILSEGDVLIARSGATVGKSYLHRATASPCAYAGYLIRFRPRPDRLLAGFLSQYLSCPRYWRWVADTQRAQAQPNINAVEYGALNLPLPGLAEQTEIIARLSAIDGAVEASMHVLGNLVSVKSALSSSLLSGEIRVIPEVAE